MSRSKMSTAAATAARADTGPDLPWPAPRDRDELHRWLREVLGVRMPRTTAVAGHTAPFEYLCHAFFEGRRRGSEASSHQANPEPSGSTPGSLDASMPSDCIVWANRGGGKTFLGAVATALDLLFKPGVQVRLLGGSLEQSARMHAHLRDLFALPDLAAQVQGRITDRRLRLRNGSGAEILAQSQSSVRGTRVQKLRCDEVELFDPRIWEAAQLVTRSKRCGDVMVRGTIECLSTMHIPHGIMHRLVEEAAQGKRTLFRWGVADVLAPCGPEHRCHAEPGAGEADRPEPDAGDRVSLAVLPGDCPLWGQCGGLAKRRSADEAGHIEVDDALDQKGRVAGATWEAEMLCLRPKRTDAVVPEFDAAVHVVSELPWERAGGHGASAVPALWLCGMDFGFRAPTVILWAAVDAEEKLWVVDERCVAGSVLSEHVGAILRAPQERGWPRPAWVGADPAGEQVDAQTAMSAADVLKRAGLEVGMRRSRVLEGIALIRARLDPADGAGARLFIHERCKELIQSLARYHYPADRPESMEPVKDGADHAVDALRYLVVNLDLSRGLKSGRYARVWPGVRAR